MTLFCIFLQPKEVYFEYYSFEVCPQTNTKVEQYTEN